MGSSAYPAMTQPFSMSHSSNMSSVGVRQDSMSKKHKFKFDFVAGSAERKFHYFLTQFSP